MVFPSLQELHVQDNWTVQDNWAVQRKVLVYFCAIHSRAETFEGLAYFS
jgi:hypothetical protein